MRHVLGIDYGEERVGISIATTSLAEPHVVLENKLGIMGKIHEICTQKKIEAVIIGISEGEMAQKSQDFGKKLAVAIAIPVEYHDETLTSYEANEKLRHTKKSRRNKPQDAYQAALMLQDYLDTQVKK